MSDTRIIRGLRKILNVHMKQVEENVMGDDDDAEVSPKLSVLERNTKTLASLIQAAERILKLDQAFKQSEGQKSDASSSRFQERARTAIVERIRSIAKRKD